MKVDRFDEIEHACLALQGTSFVVPDLTQFLLEMAAVCPMSMENRCQLSTVALLRGLDDSCLWMEPFPSEGDDVPFLETETEVPW
ncbi:MAG: hypothetical protein MJE66_15350 [Proteobacteria bacterium]|nr:hypothetical protein [Pseudomonadota bacterium]